MSKTRNLADVASGTITGNLSFSDNEKAILGDGDDLQIYHNGSDSYVDDTGTGALILRGNSNVTIGKYTGETMGYFEADGAVSLYHDNAIKLATTSGGAHVTGALSATTSMTVQNGSGTEGVRLDYNENGGEIVLMGTSGNNKLLVDYLDGNNDGNGLARYLNLGAGSDGVQLGIANASNTGGVTFTTGNNITRQHINSIGDIFSYATDGSTIGMFWDASANALNFSDNSKATFGAGSDLKIYHSGSDNMIEGVANEYLFIKHDNLLVRDLGNKDQIRTAKDGAVTLYYNSGNKLETTATGVDVTGDIRSNTAAVKVAGKETIYVPASAMYPNSTAGCSDPEQVELSNGPELKVLDFDPSTAESAQFSVVFPKSWNEGTVTFQAFFTVNGTDTGTVGWGLSGVSIADDVSTNTAFGTNVVATAKAHSGVANDLNVTAESGAVTIASAAEDCYTFFQIMRDATNDTQTADARLMGIKLFFTTNAKNDA